MRKRRVWTNEEDLYMVDNYEHEDWDVMINHLNRSERSIRGRASILGLVRGVQNYALYKGEKLLGTGTIEELAKQEGVKEMTMRYYLAPSYQKRSDNIKIPSNRRVLVKI